MRKPGHLLQGLGSGTGFLLSLGSLWRRGLQLGAEYSIPESAGNAKAILEICVVVLEVILLELLVVHRKTK